MRRDLVSVYRCPGTGEIFTLQDEVLEGDAVVSGRLVTPTGHAFQIEDGIPNLAWPLQLAEADTAIREFYDGRVAVFVGDHVVFECIGIKGQRLTKRDFHLIFTPVEI